MSHSLPTINISNEQFEAEILLQGAHLMHFAPREQKPWIFTHKQTPFIPQKEIYAGVPVVFPWFNLLRGHEHDAPNHGFARQASWTIETQSDELVSLSLSSANVKDQGLQSPFWSGDFFARMVFSFGDALGMRFEVQNRGDDTMHFDCALHTYFAVSDVHQTIVEGVPKGVLLGNGRKVGGGEFGFPPFGSCLFQGSSGPIVIREPERSLRIINNEGWQTTVVWNPGKAMEDLTEADWPRFICVEAGALRDDAVSLSAGESFALDISISLD